MHMEGGALAPSRLEHAASAAAQSRSHAQAKAQGVADKTHARFSPSAANRRIHCPPSLLLEEQFEEGESVYAAEGTAGHALAEHLIRKHLKQRTTRPTSEYYKDELLEAVDEYVSFVIGEIEDARRECHNPVLLVEQRIDASEYVDGCFGTADMVIITDKVAHVIDLKSGKGVEVHAEENPQLMIYGLGVLHMTEALYDIETVRMTIFQPRLGNSSTWSVSPEYLKRWGDEVLRPAGAQALIGAGNFSAGTWCRFCRARNQCRARAESYSKPVWVCATYNMKGRKYCASKQIPENILQQMTANVLELEEFDEEAFAAAVERIPTTNTAAPSGNATPGSSKELDAKRRT